MTEREVTHQHGHARTVALALLVLPLFAVPAYLIGNLAVDVIDDDPTNGELELGLILGIGLPGILSIILARSWRRLRRFPAFALGVGTSLVSLVVLFVAFYLLCSATDCIV